MRVTSLSLAVLSGLCAVQATTTTTKSSSTSSSVKTSTTSSKSTTSSTSSSTSSSSTSSSAASTSTPGYDCYPECITPSVSNNSLSFGEHYAVLNLDLINALVGSVNETAAGQDWINNTATWINAVHAQNPQPLSIFTRIYFSNSKQPELGNTPFAQVASGLGNASDPETALYPAFTVEEYDVVLQKTRYYAGAGNALEEILSSQKIDTVILSGIRTSGVITATAYRLFDLNYNVYVIANNTIEQAPNTPDINTNLLEGVLPKLPVSVITIEQAIAALANSGPAVY